MTSVFIRLSSSWQNCCQNSLWIQSTMAMLWRISWSIAGGRHEKLITGKIETYIFIILIKLFWIFHPLWVTDHVEGCRNLKKNSGKESLCQEGIHSITCHAYGYNSYYVHDTWTSQQERELYLVKCFSFRFFVHPLYLG